MSNPSKRSPKLKNIAGPIIIAALVAMGLGNIALAMTAAGTTISNTATATYEDPSNPGVEIPTESNTVTVTVAEVAGITNVAQTPIDVNGGSVIFGDAIEFPFIVTNEGNTASNIFIPSPDQVTTTGLDTVTVTVDLDGDGVFETTVPATGGFTTTTPIEPGEFITVKINGTVQNLPVNSIVNAQLGDTGSNDSTNADRQNQPDAGDTALPNEVRTLNVNAPDPVGGEKEAADTSIDLTVGQATPTPLALAIIRKQNGGAVINDPAVITDDQITYNLDLEVSNTSPNPAEFAAGDLEGTPITLNTGTENRILISDVIPTGTTLQSVATPPAGWTTVYSITDPATSIPIIFTGGTAAAWTTAPPTLSTVRRIGFIKNDPQLITRGSTVSGFGFTVVTSAATGTSFTVDNIAQVLGQTFGEDNGTPGDETDDPVIFDESGDDNPINFRDDGNPPDSDLDGEVDPFDPTDDNGVPDPTQGVDDSNDNDGTDDPTDNDPDGELNRVVVTVVNADLLNGPDDAPDAVGPNDIDDDFQNQSLPAADFANRTVDPTDPELTTIDDPSPVPFENNFRNNSTASLDNIVLRPIAASQADAATGTSDDRFEEDANGDGTLDTIPVGTTATITVIWNPATQVQAGGTTQTAVYEYQANGISAGVDGFVLTSGVGTDIDLDNVPSGLSIDYTVTVELPAGTPQLRGYSVPVIAYVNNDTAEQFNPAIETTFNIKIDRLYTGYLQLAKQARLLQGTGPAVAGAQGTFTADGSTLEPSTGNIVEYQITYDNISSPAAGTSTNILNATVVQVEEDGNLGGNNWAVDQDDFDGDADATTGIDTSHVTGTAIPTQGTVNFFNNNDDTTIGVEQSGSNASDDVTKYRNNVGTVAPGGTGTFTFQRQIQ